MSICRTVNRLCLMSICHTVIDNRLYTLTLMYTMHGFLRIRVGRASARGVGVDSALPQEISELQEERAPKMLHRMPGRGEMALIG